MSKKKSKLTLAELADRVAAIAPHGLAESWDNVGLQIGDPSARVRRVMTCLEVTDPTLAEARRRRADVLIAHHPLIFRPARSIVESNPPERLVAALIRSRIHLIVAHTNLDCAQWGTNEVLAEQCGLQPVGPLAPKETPAPYKFVVFTPKGHERAIIDAIHRGGGGRIGAYTHCTFRSPGTGSFLGGEGAKPFIGRAGRLEQADEYRIEAVVPVEARGEVLAEVAAAHPYDEPAFEFYLLAPDRATAGLGCLAKTPKPVTAKRLAQTIKRRLGIQHVRVSGPLDRIVERVAICTGSGGSLLSTAASAGAGALLTGEATYHHGVEACQRGIALIEIGHFESERIVAAPLAERLAKDPAISSAAVTIFSASDDLQPFVML